MENSGSVVLREAELKFCLNTDNITAKNITSKFSDILKITRVSEVIFEATSMHSHKEKHAKVLLSWMEPSNKYQGHVLGPTGHLNCETSQIKAFVPVSGFQLLCYEFLFHSRRREIRLKSCQDQTSQIPQFISPRTANNYAQTIKPNRIQFKSFRLKYQPSCIGI